MLSDENLGWIMSRAVDLYCSSGLEILRAKDGDSYFSYERAVSLLTQLSEEVPVKLSVIAIRTRLVESDIVSLVHHSSRLKEKFVIDKGNLVPRHFIQHLHQVLEVDLNKRGILYLKNPEYNLKILSDNLLKSEVFTSLSQVFAQSDLQIVGNYAITNCHIDFIKEIASSVLGEIKSYLSLEDTIVLVESRVCTVIRAESLKPIVKLLSIRNSLTEMNWKGEYSTKHTMFLSQRYLDSTLNDLEENLCVQGSVPKKAIEERYYDCELFARSCRIFVTTFVSFIASERYLEECSKLKIVQCSKLFAQDICPKEVKDIKRYMSQVLQRTFIQVGVYLISESMAHHLEICLEQHIQERATSFSMPRECLSAKQIENLFSQLNFRVSNIEGLHEIDELLFNTFVLENKRKHFKCYKKVIQDIQVKSIEERRSIQATRVKEQFLKSDESDKRDFSSVVKLKKQFYEIYFGPEKPKSVSSVSYQRLLNGLDRLRSECSAELLEKDTDEVKKMYSLLLFPLILVVAKLYLAKTKPELCKRLESTTDISALVKVVKEMEVCPEIRILIKFCSSFEGETKLADLSSILRMFCSTRVS